MQTSEYFDFATVENPCSLASFVVKRGGQGSDGPNCAE
jgi:hypothetical protein